jgi:apolipoprotein N-acyltransferase
MEEARAIITLKCNKLNSATISDAYRYIHLCAFKGLPTANALVCFEIAKSIFARDNATQYTVLLMNLHYALLMDDTAGIANSAAGILRDE